MEVAVSAAEHARRRTDPTSRRRRFTSGPDYAPKIVEMVTIRDTEGTIRYKRADGGRKTKTVFLCLLTNSFSIIERGE